MEVARICDQADKGLDIPLSTRRIERVVEPRPLSSFSITDIIAAQDLCIQRPNLAAEIEPV